MPIILTIPMEFDKEIANAYMIDSPILDEFAVDNGAFDYHRYAPRPASTSKTFDPSSFIMDSDLNITITLSDDKILKNCLICYKIMEKQTITKSLVQP